MINTVDIGEAMLHETIQTIRCEGIFFNRREPRSLQEHVHLPDDSEIVTPVDLAVCVYYDIDIEFGRRQDVL